MITRLHELLAAEKTPNGAWDQILAETIHKFKTPETFFHGHSKSLKMIAESPENSATENAAREEKPVVTTVYDTLEWALDIYARAENLQYQKNITNQRAIGTVMWKGKPFLENLPVDELLGLESRLKKIRELYGVLPTLDASKFWTRDDDHKRRSWVTQHQEIKTKTDKQIIPVQMAKATDKHPEQVHPVQKDVVVGHFTTIGRSGEITAHQKADAIKLVDELIMEIKQARMRANETEVVDGSIAKKLTDLLIEPFIN